MTLMKLDLVYHDCFILTIDGSYAYPISGDICLLVPIVQIVLADKTGRSLSTTSGKSDPERLRRTYFRTITCATAPGLSNAYARVFFALRSPASGTVRNTSPNRRLPLGAQPGLQIGSE